MMDTGQYKEVVDVMNKEVVMMEPYIDLGRTASRAYYMWLDSTSASEVYGVKTLVVYNLVKATEVGYIRKDSWDQSKFEDHNHRKATTMSLNAKTDYISDLLEYRSVFEVNFMEKYKVRHCRLDYIAVDPGG